MKRSKTWTIEHEVSSRSIEEVQERFAGKYGEISPLLRTVFDEIEVDKKGVILRHPTDLWRSVRMWTLIHNPGTNSRYCTIKAWGLFRIGLKNIDRLAEKYDHILFHKMVKNKKYLLGVLKDFGIKDVKTVNLKPVNDLNPKELHPIWLERVENEFGWFSKKYNLKRC